MSQWMVKVVRAFLMIGLTSLGMSGCDYWPPALQAQIEQMQVEAQIATAERAKLQGQLTDTMKVKEELQIRVDELARSNRELSGRITALEQTLSVERQKVGRLIKPAQKPTGPKATLQSAQKSSSKKKPTNTKTIAKRRPN